MLSGCSSLNELESLKTELTQLFKSAGMSLHKWCFSHSTNNFPDLHFDQSCEESITKTLGVLWNSSSDTFCLKVSPSTNHIFTKRDVLSQIARIFDPLGLLGPVISKAKFFMQQLWFLKLEWHQKLFVPVAAEWASFVQSLPVLKRLKIPRFVLSENLESIILYGFIDASEKGFGAVTYVSVIKNNGDRHSQLLCNKSKVAPLKTLTIPRLELSPCLLLSKLIRKVINALKMNLSQVILFSDSTIALSWINTPPHLLKTFVANRVAKIQELTVKFSWHHISSQNNPADLVSRCLSVSDLTNSPLWWKCPDPSIFKNDELLENINDCEVKKEFKIPPSKNLLLSSEFDLCNHIISITNNYWENIEIKKLHDLVKAPDETLVNYFNDEHIDWNFIPPRSPNFGGLWESDESCTIKDMAQVAVFVRYMSSQVPKEKLLGLLPLSGQTRGECREKCLEDNKIDLNKIVSIATDGDRRNRDYTGMWVRPGSTDLMAGKVVFLRGLLKPIRVVDLTVMNP
ncbi:uncharacterized protein TNCV_4288331 [Trichonephila clavipes]|nr:uncharacterized protein TNCV_4288331 [Trichonephila clavipes]